jgi:hypothetical protein
MYIGTLLAALVVLSRHVWKVVWHMSLAVYLWLAFVEGHHIVFKGTRLVDSTLMWVSCVSLLFEFVVARIMSNSLLKVCILVHYTYEMANRFECRV